MGKRTMTILDLFTGWRNTADFESGHVIFSESDSAEDLYVVLAGEVELTLHGKSLGREQAGGIIGEMAFIDDARLNATATAVGAVKLARMSREEFSDLIRTNAEFSLHALAEMAQRLRSVDRYISNQLEL